jgi:hypothetical protein
LECTALGTGGLDVGYAHPVLDAAAFLAGRSRAGDTHLECLMVLRACWTDGRTIADAVSVVECQPFGTLGLFDADTSFGIEAVVFGTSGTLLRLAHFAVILEIRRTGGRPSHAGLALPYG